jgi:RHS repeat-associated protein
MGSDNNGNLTTRSNATTGENWYLKWNGFDKPRWMMKAAGGATAGYEYLYNTHRSRVAELEFDSKTGTTPNFSPLHYTWKRIYALGSTLEIDYNNTASSGSPIWNHSKARIYVPAPDGIAGTMELTPTTAGGFTERAEVYHYDHLGSIECITPYGSTSTYAVDDLNKTARYSEDAWGQRRKPASWNASPDSTTSSGGHTDLTPRGFTGHEMLDGIGLVHMNGRIYDPLLGRFLSADVFVQFPTVLGSYNRYSYVSNNPLRYTDTSGFDRSDLSDDRRALAEKRKKELAKNPPKQPDKLDQKPKWNQFITYVRTSPGGRATIFTPADLTPDHPQLIDANAVHNTVIETVDLKDSLGGTALTALVKTNAINLSNGEPNEVTSQTSVEVKQRVTEVTQSVERTRNGETVMHAKQSNPTVQTTGRIELGNDRRSETGRAGADAAALAGQFMEGTAQAIEYSQVQVGLVFNTNIFGGAGAPKGQLVLQEPADIEKIKDFASDNGLPPVNVSDRTVTIGDQK